MDMNETLSIKVTQEQKLRLKQIATDRKKKPSALIREALDLVLGENTSAGKLSLYELSKDILEKVEASGMSDLSTNKKHFEGFGR